MKRDYPNQNHALFTGSSSSTPPPLPDLTGKSKMWDEFNEQDIGVDELLAVFGYKVKSSDRVDVAQKIEHLEGRFIKR
ncbi:putative transcription factor GRAS family [Helianthus anomalus]